MLHARPLPRKNTLSLSLFFRYSARAERQAMEETWRDSNEHVKNAGTKSNGGGRWRVGRG